MFHFKITHQEKGSRARLGILTTPHGVIHTPAFIPVGSAATVKSLTPEEVVASQTEIFFVNTYHLYLQPGALTIKKLGGLHRFMNWGKPLISDSGGFQVFSLAKEKEKKMVKVTNDGVYFRSHLDGSKHFFTPEKSIEIQAQLGADLILCLDECTFYPASIDYTKESCARTHHWAQKSLTTYQKLKVVNQALYGVIQGGIYQDLRVQSAKFMASLPVFALAIGGVSVGESKEEMKMVLDWVTPYLPDDKPRHLLGVGEIDDIFALVERGIDTFDCVMPTRLGRMGQVLVKPTAKSQMSMVNGQWSKVNRWQIDITKSIYAADRSPIDLLCPCFVCGNFSRAYINHLFRARELLAYRLASFHNLFFLQNLVRQIRSAIKQDRFLTLKEKWL